MRIAIIISQFNKEISDRLLAGAKRALQEAGFYEKDFRIFEVPGAFEIPFAAAKLTDSNRRSRSEAKQITRPKGATIKFDGIIALGCVLQGETDHYRAICDGVTYGIQKVSIENRIPIMFGVLMCKTKKQGLERSENNKTNKGYECAEGLMEILKRKL